jgi:hypothetical protein
MMNILRRHHVLEISSDVLPHPKIGSHLRQSGAAHRFLLHYHRQYVSSLNVATNISCLAHARSHFDEDDDVSDAGSDDVGDDGLPCRLVPP